MIGAQLVNQPGTFTWNDLGTNDLGKAGEFYQSLFGWGVDPMSGETATIWTLDGEQVCGAHKAAEGEFPAWSAVPRRGHRQVRGPGERTRRIDPDAPERHGMGPGCGCGRPPRCGIRHRKPHLRPRLSHLSPRPPQSGAPWTAAATTVAHR
jgi:hypothetical protein